MTDEITATHVHIDESSADCDGQYDRSHIEPGDLSKYFRWFHLPITNAGQFSLDCREGLWHLEFGSPTDEGFTNTIIEECMDVTCDFDKSSFRDHAAEAAGY
jgi:hypothetical protein